MYSNSVFKCISGIINENLILFEGYVRTNVVEIVWENTFLCVKLNDETYYIAVVWFQKYILRHTLET